jgi:hypothetical protein
MKELKEYQLKQIELFKNRYIEVYIGENDKPTEMNLYDYLTDKSINAGFDSYEELLQEGLNIDIPDSYSYDTNDYKLSYQNNKEIIKNKSLDLIEKIGTNTYVVKIKNMSLTLINNIEVERKTNVNLTITSMDAINEFNKTGVLKEKEGILIIQVEKGKTRYIQSAYKNHMTSNRFFNAIREHKQVPILDIKDNQYPYNPDKYDYLYCSSDITGIRFYDLNNKFLKVPVHFKISENDFDNSDDFYDCKDILERQNSSLIESDYAIHIDGDTYEAYIEGYIYLNEEQYNEYCQNYIINNTKNYISGLVIHFEIQLKNKDDVEFDGI